MAVYFRPDFCIAFLSDIIIIRKNEYVGIYGVTFRNVVRQAISIKDCMVHNKNHYQLLFLVSSVVRQSDH